MKLLYFATLLVASCFVTAQPNLKWSSQFISDWDTVYRPLPRFEQDSSQVTVSGVSRSLGGHRVSVVKYDLGSGTKISDTEVGADSVVSNITADYLITKTKDILIANNEDVPNTLATRIVLQKYDQAGVLKWACRVAGNKDTAYHAESLIMVNDTCFFLNAYRIYNLRAPGDDIDTSTSHAAVFLYNTSGKLLWRKVFNEVTETHYFTHKPVVFKNGILFFGLKNYSTRCLVRVTINKNISSVTTPTTGVIRKVRADSTLLITSIADYRLIKCNINGAVLWNDSLGTHLPYNVMADRIFDLYEDAGGDIYVTGSHHGSKYGDTNSTFMDIVTAKYQFNGVRSWVYRHPSPPNSQDFGKRIVLKNQKVYIGGFVSANWMTNDRKYSVVKLNAGSGAYLGEYIYAGSANLHNEISDLNVISDSCVLLTGVTTDNTRNWTTQRLSDIKVGLPEVSDREKFKIYPNPATNGLLRIKSSEQITWWGIFDLTGKLIKSSGAVERSQSTIDCADLNPGLYLVHVQSKTSRTNHKLIIQ